MSTIQVAGIIRESIVDGPGIRFVVFTQGCPHRCEGCHNEKTWPFEGGFSTTPEKLIEEIAKNPLLAGITLSGGEPFCQPEGMAELAHLCHERKLHVMVYTGYLFEKLLEHAQEQPSVAALLQETDVLVDGPFVADLKSYELKFCGSSNQRLIDVPKSLECGEAVPAAL